MSGESPTQRSIEAQLGATLALLQRRNREAAVEGIPEGWEELWALMASIPDEVLDAYLFDGPAKAWDLLGELVAECEWWGRRLELGLDVEVSP